MKKTLITLFFLSFTFNFYTTHAADAQASSIAEAMKAEEKKVEKKKVEKRAPERKTYGACYWAGGPNGERGCEDVVDLAECQQFIAKHAYGRERWQPGEACKK